MLGNMTPFMSAMACVILGWTAPLAVHALHAHVAYRPGYPVGSMAVIGPATVSVVLILVMVLLVLLVLVLPLFLALRRVQMRQRQTDSFNAILTDSAVAFGVLAAVALGVFLVWANKPASPLAIGIGIAITAFSALFWAGGYWRSVRRLQTLGHAA